jgi:nucleotide-binding universal stress UspA family protein
VIKRILVPLDPSPYTDTAIEVACDRAKVSEAELTGLVVIDIPGIEESIGPIPVGGLYYAEKMEMAKKLEASQRVEALLDKFKKKCEDKGIAYREAHTQGYPSTQILKESIFYDMVIIGLRTYFNFTTTEKAGDSLEKILKQAITPIFGVPEKFAFSNDPNSKTNVLIAFDGSPLSARALQRFAQLITPKTMQITLLNSSENREMGEYLLNQAEIYLNAHAIMDVKKEWISDDIKKVITNKYLVDADVFVVGAHAREGLFDFFVGSLTRFLVEQAQKPVFIGQ